MMIAVAACVGTLGCTDGTAPRAPLTPLDTLLVEMLQWQEFLSTAYAPGAHDTPRAASCPFDEHSNEFVCPAVRDQGLTLALRFQLLDEAGQALRAYTPSTVDAIRTIAHVTGQFENTGAAVARVESRQDHVLRGLTRGTRLMSGSGTMTNWWRLHADSGSVSADQVITDLALPHDTSADGFRIPGAGMIDVRYHGPGYESTGAIDTRLLLTFNGTFVASLVRTTFGVTQQCTWDFGQRDPEAGNGISCEPAPGN
jgi:hypothetical protein